MNPVTKYTKMVHYRRTRIKISWWAWVLLAVATYLCACAEVGWSQLDPNLPLADHDLNLDLHVIPPDLPGPYHACHCKDEVMRKFLERPENTFYSCRKCYFPGIDTWDMRHVFEDKDPTSNPYYTIKTCEMDFRRNSQDPKLDDKDPFKVLKRRESLTRPLTPPESDPFFRFISDVFYCPSKDHPTDRMEDCMCMCNPFPKNWEDYTVDSRKIKNILRVSPVYCMTDPCNKLIIDVDRTLEPHTVKEVKVEDTSNCKQKDDKAYCTREPRPWLWDWVSHPRDPKKSYCAHCNSDEECKKGGTCDPLPNHGYGLPDDYFRKCHCLETGGPTCELDPCKDHEKDCKRGKCKAEEDGIAWNCDCDSGWHGERCDLENQCELGITCVNALKPEACEEVSDPAAGKEDFKCPGGCKPGWSGEKCDEENECETHNFEQCSGCTACCKTKLVAESNKHIQKFEKCDCSLRKPQAHGEKCQYRNECPKKPCNIQGTEGSCQENPTGESRICNCKKGFSGPDCSKEDFCVTTHLKACDAAHGKCDGTKSTETLVVCKCDPEYGPTTSCKNLECHSYKRCGETGGKVIANTAKGTCTCECTGKYKKSPRNPSKECILDKCHGRCEQGGVCIRGANEDDEPTCDCSKTNFGGEKCTILNKCKEFPGICGHGQCDFHPEDLENHYTCTCNHGWYDHKGTHCAYFNPCVPELKTEPCKNFGKCIHEEHEKDGFTCKCRTEEGWEGADCSIRNTCISNMYKQRPCQNGATCKHTGRNELDYNCECPEPKFYGELCEFIDRCVEDNKCQNGATCVRNKNEFTCTCLLGFSGEFCQDEDVCITKRDKVECRKPSTECQRADGSNTEYKCDCDTTSPYRGQYCSVLNLCLLEQPGKCYSDIEGEQKCFPCANGKCVVDINELNKLLQVKNRTVNEVPHSCDCSGVNFIGKKCEIPKTDVSLEFPSELTPGQYPPNPFRIVLNSLGAEPFEMDVDLGDGFRFKLTTANFQETDSRPGKLVYEFNQRYVDPGDVLVAVSWRNMNTDAGLLTEKISVKNSAGCMPIKVNLLNCGRSPNENDGSGGPGLICYKRKARFVISAAIDYINCPETKHSQLEESIQFDWQLNQLSDTLPFPSRANQGDLGSSITEGFDEKAKNKIVTFVPYGINAGVYWISVDVSLQFEDGKKTISTFDRCFFKVENEAPSVTIIGGIDRTVQLGSVVKIDARATDLSDLRNTDFLEYTWWYTRGPTSFRRDCGTFSKICGRPTLTIDPAFHKLEITEKESPYIFSLQVRSDYSKLTLEPVVQRIHVRELGLAVNAKLRCIRNCDRLLNIGDKVLIECSCEGCDDDIDLNYSMQLFVENEPSISILETTSGSRLFMYELKNPGIHNFVCYGDDADSFNGESKVEIIVNSPPQPGDGKCTVTNTKAGASEPLTGTFLKDKFNSKCDDFTTSKPNEPLMYLVYAKIPGVEKSVSDHLPRGILLFHGVSPVAENLVLPSGLGPDSQVEISTKVVDAVGGYAWTKPVLVTIKPLATAEAKGEISKYLDDASDIEGGNVGRRMEAGDDQGAMQIILGILYSYVGLKFDQPSVQTQWDKIKQEFLLAIGRLLTKIELKLTSNYVLAHVAQAHYLLCSVYVDQNMKLETLDICKYLLDDISKILKQTVRNHTEVFTTEDIGLIARGVKEAGSSMLREVSDRGTKKLKEREQRSFETGTEDESNSTQPSPGRLTPEEVLSIDEIDRDYFSDPYFEDDTVKTNASAFLDVNDFNLSSKEVEKLAAIGRGVLDQMEQIMEAAAEREVDRFDFELDKCNGKGENKCKDKSMEPNIRATVHVVKANDITDKDFGNSGAEATVKITGDDFKKFLNDQGVTDVYVEIVESDSNPYFGDTDYPVDTKVTSVILKNGKNGDPIPITKNTTVDVYIEWKEVGTRRQTFQVTAPLVPGIEIEPSVNVNVQKVHLPPGSQLQVYIDPDPKYPDLLYMVVASQDIPLKRKDFCISINTKEPVDSGRSQDVNPSPTAWHNTVNPVNRTFANFYVEDLHESADEIERVKRYVYYIGIWPHEHVDAAGMGSLIPFKDANNQPTNITFNVSFTQTSCIMRDENKNRWDDTQCAIGPNTTTKVLHCRCQHLSVFAGSVFIPPNSIDFVHDIELILGVDHVPVVMATLGAILFLYICLLVLCYLLDRKDKTHHVGLVIMTRIGEDFEHSFYLITVITGSRFLAGTSANVSIQLYGSNGRSQAYVIKDPTLPVLNRGGNDSFLVSSKKDLGNLEKIRVWHDNSGGAPGWYLRKVMIQDVKTNEKWVFLVETWLSLTYEDDPAIVREIPVSGPKEQNKWSRRFRERFFDELNNTHIWFSVFLKYPTSHFTRCQRLTCALAILTSYMLINIMWFGIPTTDIKSHIEFGIFSFEILSIWLSLQITIYALPFGVVLVRLFQRIRQRYIPTLIIWKNHTKLKLEYDEARFFLPDDSGIVKEIVPVARVPVDDQPVETRREFSLPGTNIAKCEKWALEVTKGLNLKDPINVPQLIRCVDEEGNTVSHADKNESCNPQINSFGRYAVMDFVRRKVDAFSFFYAGDNSNKRIEELIDEELRRYPSQMAHMKKEDLDRARDETRKRRSNLPNIEPVQIIERPMTTDDENGEEIGPAQPPKYGIALELYEMPPVAKVCFYAPWWFVYAAWFICVVVILFCSLVTIVYGLRYGRLRSLKWTAGIFLSWAQSLFVVQPFTIFILALISTFLCSNAGEMEEERFQILFKDDGEYIGKPNPLRMRTFHPLQEYPPLTGAEVFALRIKARRKNTLLKSAISIGFHVLLIIFLCFIANSNHSFDDYYLTNHMERLLEINDLAFCPDCVNELDLVHDEASFFRYVTEVFLPAVNPMERYDGQRLKALGPNDPTIMKDEITLLVGVPRIRQLRIRPRDCKIPRNLKILIAGNASVTDPTAPPGSLDTFDCITNYETKYGDHEMYNPYWMPVVEGRTFKSKNDVWKYRPASETLSLGRRGLLAYYDGGGYVAELGKDTRRSASVIGYLERTKWVDHRTRGILIEFVAFNPNLNLFADVVIIFERSPSTAFRAKASITPLRLSNANMDEDYANWIIACYIAVGLLLCILSYLLVKDVVYHWKHYRCHLFSNFWLWADLLIILVCTSSLIVAYYSAVLFNEVNKRLQTALINQYVSFQEAALWNFIHTTMFALSLCLCLMKFWKLLVLSFKRFFIMSLTLKLTSRFLLALMFLLGVLFTAFAMLGNVVFGGTLLQFHSFSHAFLELVNQILNVDFYPDLYQTHSILGPMFYFVFGFVVCCIGLNIFIALLNQGFMEAKEVAAQKRNWLTYWSYLRNWCLRSRWFRRFAPPRHLDPNQKLTIQPRRLIRMKRATTEFINACLLEQGVVRMDEMRKCAETLLMGTEYSILSKTEKWRRIRNKLNASRVSEERMDQMRTSTAHFIKETKQLYFTGQDYKKFAEFDMEILNLKCVKVEQLLDEAIPELDEYLGAKRENDKVRAAKKKMEAITASARRKSSVEEEFERRRKVSLLDPNPKS